MVEVAVAMDVETIASGSLSFYSAVAEMDLDSVATVVDATVVATTDAASFFQKGLRYAASYT